MRFIALRSPGISSGKSNQRAKAGKGHIWFLDQTAKGTLEACCWWCKDASQINWNQSSCNKRIYNWGRKTWCRGGSGVFRQSCTTTSIWEHQRETVGEGETALSSVVVQRTREDSLHWEVDGLDSEGVVEGNILAVAIASGFSPDISKHAFTLLMVEAYLNASLKTSHLETIKFGFEKLRICWSDPSEV